MYISVQPNPASDFVQFNYYLPDEENGQLIVYDILGKVIFEKMLASGSNSIDVRTSAWAQGVYGYSLLSNGQYVKGAKLVITK